MKDKIKVGLLAFGLFGGLALAGSESALMPWLNLAGVIMLGITAIAASELVRKEGL
jgi:hypothetical protein